MKLNETRLLARAQVARQLIRHGHVAPYVALSFVVWPSEALREAERRVARSTLIGRVWSDAA